MIRHACDVVIGTVTRVRFGPLDVKQRYRSLRDHEPQLLVLYRTVIEQRDISARVDADCLASCRGISSTSASTWVYPRQVAYAI